MKKVARKVGTYEVGRTIGEGNFAKVKFAKNIETGESVAIKILSKSTILKHKMVDQIKREISIMKIVRHPNIVKLHEVLSSRTKIYIILEFVSGGELFDKIDVQAHQGRLSENKSRRYFQQLIHAVAHCHRKGVYHRDLKPENLLLDAYGNLKVSDFGLSALPQKGVGLLHTTCGTPNYVAPEVLGHQGYDGAAADVWSCGVILFVLMAGYLPFDEIDLPTLNRRHFISCPWRFQLQTATDNLAFLLAMHGEMVKSPCSPCSIPQNATFHTVPPKALIDMILDPNPKTRIGIEGIKKHPWFSQSYESYGHREEEEVNLDDVRAVFDEIEDHSVAERLENSEGGPLVMNAFEIITLGLNLSALFDRRQDFVKRQTRFVSRKPAKSYNFSNRICRGINESQVPYT
ncbi:NON-SPECIFIC SERINE/THREONINE PROTEIN KINASE [Salix koriyanagi]|uniref:non-specific serine/threonine protein kinase n=1 Tax=Salix koriyanagi TaxID=2511006 RepID=A0A9Q0VFF7_9ROSI|nr:NON-SPECIFIC SERINE/THREONINE PROTEIN KINASE [Salix koriyanagi]KAJ6747291.1 NON-SPECIFIC SERINE/THREONINE PROTEIN KINASE [Salix koriyanagi]